MAMDTDVPIIDTAIQGWRDAMAAREKMPTLFWVAIAVMIGLGLLHFLSGVWLFLPLLSGVVFSVAQALALTPLAIAVHRFVLLDEIHDSYDFAPGDPRFQKFFVFTIALELLGAIPQVIAYLFAAVSTFLSSIVLLVLAVVTTIVAVRTVILFPSIAVDATGAEWRNAMADTKGQSWSVFFVLVCAVLPASVVSIVVVALFSASWLLTLVVLGFILPVITVFMVAAVAAAVSRLFAAYANQLGQPTNLHLRAVV
ncbi:MAG: hypothetical protein ABSE69_20135 [Roseiarcus sp.]|jgi:hypothetical protein